MFNIRNYSSDERYDIAKFMEFNGDCYDVVNSPFLNRLKDLPIKEYYSVNKGYKTIDMISQHVYKTPIYAYYILYYNDLVDETVPENTVLKLFDIVDLDNLFFEISS